MKHFEANGIISLNLKGSDLFLNWLYAVNEALLLPLLYIKVNKKYTNVFGFLQSTSKTPNMCPHSMTQVSVSSLQWVRNNQGFKSSATSYIYKSSGTTLKTLITPNSLKWGNWDLGHGMWTHNGCFRGRLQYSNKFGVFLIDLYVK